MASVTPSNGSSGAPSSRASKASIKIPARSPYSQKLLDSYVSELNDAADLVLVGHYNSDEEREHKKDAKQRYNVGRDKRAEMLLSHEAERRTTQNAGLKRRLETSDQEESHSDEGGAFGERCSSAKQSKGSRNSRKSRESQATVKSRSKRLWKDAGPTPKNATLNEQVAYLEKLIAGAVTVLYDPDQNSTSYANEVSAEEAKDSQSFKTWVPCETQPHEDKVTDYECAICKRAKLSGVKFAREARVSLLDADKVKSPLWQAP